MKVSELMTQRPVTVGPDATCGEAATRPQACRVSEVMSADPLTVTPDDEIAQAEKVMSERQVRRLPVVSDGKLVGILVTAQIARAESERKTGETIKEISGAASRKASHARS